MTFTQGMAPQAFPPSATTIPASATAGLPPVGSNAGALNIQGKDGFPSFSFNFGQEQATAYEQLRPFYEKLLSFAAGDVDLAKRMLEYSYSQGMRESTAEAEASRKELALTQPAETEQKQTEQLRRGVYSSGFGETERKRLSDQQLLRREAVDRALEERTSRLTAQKGFGLEEQGRGLEQKTFGLERERRGEASDIANAKFGIKSTEYQAALQEAQRQEQKRITDEQNAMQKKIYEQQGYKL